jgi:hypothetical protein
MNELVKWKPDDGAAKRIDRAMQLIRARPSLGGHDVELVQEARHLPVARDASLVKGVVDLLRVCAVHDRPWAARYVAGDGGIFHYADSVAITETLFRRQYAGGKRVIVPSSCIGEETCAWCGVSRTGAVYCPACKSLVCYGRTVVKEFRCRPSCGNAGRLEPTHITYEGIVPEVGP